MAVRAWCMSLRVMGGVLEKLREIWYVKMLVF